MIQILKKLFFNLCLPKTVYYWYLHYKNVTGKICFVFLNIYMMYKYNIKIDIYSDI